ncbi:MAG: hypothetical protein ACHQAY_07095 [Hyphomicrobiales bacterium]
MRQGSTHIRRRIGLAVAIVCAAAMFSAPASAGSGRLSDSGRFSGSQATVDHDGIYLAQRIGQCLNRSGPCYFGGQCPGGEYTSSAYTNGRVYCSSFYPPEPYPPSIFQRLLGIP